MNCSLFNLFAIGALCAIATVAYLKWCLTYWKRKGLPYLEGHLPLTPKDFIAFSQPLNAIIYDSYKKAKAIGAKICGIYFGATPILLVSDLDALREIMVKDFNIWSSRGLYYNEKSDPLSAHLFAIDGKKWKTLRTKLTPTFTSGKMKSMFQSIVDCSPPMIDFVDGKVQQSEPVNIKDVLCRFTTDVIGSCAFGLNCNSFTDPNSEFASIGLKFFSPDLIGRLKIFLSVILPNFCQWIGLKITSKKMSDFYLNITRNTVKYREENNINRKDFMQILIDLKNNKNPQFENLTMDEISAMSFIFYLAGFETSSTATTFATYELGIHQEIQEKLRQEIVEVLQKHDGKITYDSLKDMTYLDQVVNEALRKYPPAFILRRQNTQPYKFPGTDVVIDKNTLTIISTYGIQHDPDYYPDPERFDPERFSEENKKNRHPFAFLAFGEGPRVCIGERFGYLEIKVALISLLTKYKWKLNARTPIPLTFNKNSFTLGATDPIMLDVERL